MKLSMWSSFFICETPEKMADLLLAGGFRYTELSFEHSAVLMKRDDGGASFKKYIDDKDFAIPQGHLNFSFIPGTDVLTDLASFDEKIRRDSIDGWKRELELFEMLGIERAVLHPGGMSTFVRGEKSVTEIDDQRTKGLVELAEFTKGMNVMVCLENMATGYYMSCAESLIGAIEKTGTDNIRICLDTGHLNIRKRQEHDDFIRICGKKYLQALHIADNDGRSDEHLLPGGGTVDWKKTAEALREIGYDRLLNFEIPGANYATCFGNEELRKMFLPFAKKVGEVVFEGL